MGRSRRCCLSVGACVPWEARRRRAGGPADRRPLFSDIVEGGGQSPLSARSASFGVFVRCVGIVWKVLRLRGGRARRRFAGRLLLGMDAVSHSTLLTSAESCVPGRAGATGAISADAPAARARQRIILAPFKPSILRSS